MTKGHPNKSAFFLDKSEHFQRDTELTQMEQKNARKNEEENKFHNNFCSHLQTGRSPIIQQSLR